MKKIFYCLLTLALFWVPLGTVHAWSGHPQGQVIFGQNFTLQSGQTLDGDLVVFGGEATIEQGATVKGSAVVFGGSLSVDGTITKDAVTIGGTLALGATASAAGNVVIQGGTLHRDLAAHVGGQVYSNVGPNAQIPAAPGGGTLPARPAIDLAFNPFLDTLLTFTRALGVAIAIAALAMLLVIFLQPQLERVAQAVVLEPIMAGGMGLLTVVVVPFAILMLALLSLTVILIPITVPLAFVVGVLVCLAWLFGVIALGLEVGERFSTALHQTWAPVLSAGVGTFLLMFVGGIAVLIPCVGWLLPLLIGLAAIGAAVLTTFGSHPLHRTGAAASLPAAQSSEPPAVG